jgi:hypothetical protein
LGDVIVNQYNTNTNTNKPGGLNYNPFGWPVAVAGLPLPPTYLLPAEKYFIPVGDLNPYQTIGAPGQVQWWDSPLLGDSPVAAVAATAQPTTEPTTTPAPFVEEDEDMKITQDPDYLSYTLPPVDPLPASNPLVPGSSTAPKKKSSKMNIWMIVCLVVLLLVGCGAAFWFMKRRKGRGSPMFL